MLNWAVVHASTRPIDALTHSTVWFRTLSITAWTVAWVVMRSIVGLADANVVLTRESAAAALRSSVRYSRSHRLAASLSRLALAPLMVATTWSLLGTRQDDWSSHIYGATIALSLAITLDGAIEHAWHERVRGSADSDELAAIFLEETR